MQLRYFKSVQRSESNMEVDVPFVCAPSTENSTNAAANTATAALAHLVPIVDVGSSTHLSTKFEVSLKMEGRVDALTHCRCSHFSSLCLLFGEEVHSPMGALVEST